MQKDTIKIAIAGPRRRMGSEAVKLVEDTAHFELVGAIDRTYNREKLSNVMTSSSDAVIYTNITVICTVDCTDKFKMCGIFNKFDCFASHSSARSCYCDFNGILLHLDSPLLSFFFSCPVIFITGVELLHDYIMRFI